MFSKYLVKAFIKNYKDVTNSKVRDNYGVFAGSVGILSNLLLFIVKLTTGLLTNSIAVIADAINNFTDVLSSVITIFGFKMSSKPADKEHPFGHGRIEYISGMIVSFLVMLVGLEFIKTSFNRIKAPEKVNFELIPFILLIISIFIKVWLSSFNKYIGNSINSSALKASSFDALSDVFTSTCTAASLLISKWTSFPVDGYVGIVVSIFILYSGYSLIKETLNPLLGAAPDPILVKDIKEGLLKYENILGLHDLIIHNYGPGRCIVSVHAEVPENISIVKIHEDIDKAERELSESLKIFLSIHMDPICNDDIEVLKIKDEVKEIIEKIPEIHSMHDFRIVGNGNIRNLIFDIVLNNNYNFTKKYEDEVKTNLENMIKEIHPGFNLIITADHDFTP